LILKVISAIDRSHAGTHPGELHQGFGAELPGSDYPLVSQDILFGSVQSAEKCQKTRRRIQAARGFRPGRMCYVKVLALGFMAIHTIKGLICHALSDLCASVHKTSNLEVYSGGTARLEQSGMAVAAGASMFLDGCSPS
jgi:hypothetical protein